MVTIFKKQNGKRRWRKILWLEGKHSRKEIKWYADLDREMQESFYESGGRCWKDNVNWRQDSLSDMNNWKLFAKVISELN